MTLAALIRADLTKIGYSAIVNDYRFSDVFAPSGGDRTVPIAAFTHTPPSYRNAALGVVHANARLGAATVSEYRALGAPLLFVIEQEEVTVWQVRPETGSSPIARANQSELSALFEKFKDVWNPRAIHLAKSLGQFNHENQLDFVDLGLLVAIEGEIHSKLDHLLSGALLKAIDLKSGTALIDEEQLFRAVFRFLAAKILHDRSHKVSETWDDQQVRGRSARAARRW